MLSGGLHRSQLKTGKRNLLGRQESEKISSVSPPAATPSHETLKTGARPVLQESIKVFKPGEVLFNEGERGREMFIIKSGKVSIFKKEGDLETELIQLGAGSVIGEMSLLDNMPRSASGRALEETKVTLINELIFNSVMEKVPLWLRGVVKIITSRIRDTNKRVGKDVVKFKESGLAHFLYLLNTKYGKSKEGLAGLPIRFVFYEILKTMRQPESEVRTLLSKLMQRELIQLEQNEKGEETIKIPFPEALELFNEYSQLKVLGKNLPGSGISENALKLLECVLAAGNASAQQSDKGDFIYFHDLMNMVRTQAVEFDEKYLTELQNREVVYRLEADPANSKMGERFQFEFSKVEKILLIRNWKNKFELQV